MCEHCFGETFVEVPHACDAKRANFSDKQVGVAKTVIGKRVTRSKILDEVQQTVAGGAAAEKKRQRVKE